MIDELRKTPIHVLITGIALPNEAGIALHESPGFNKIGQFPEVGYKFEKYIDIASAVDFMVVDFMAVDLIKVRDSSLKQQKTLSIMILSLLLSSCIGTVVGVAVDTTIEVAKVPFKVVGAAVDLAIPDDEDD